MEEMSKLMNCFKRENFEDQKCSKEIAEFLECAGTAVSREKQHILLMSAEVSDFLKQVT